MRSAIPLLLISCCAPAAQAREEFKRDFSKTAALAAGRPLRVEHAHGRVSVKTHALAEARIVASIRCSAPTAAEAQACAGRVQINVSESAAGVAVRTEYPQNWRNISYRVDMDITMPQASPLELRNRFGSTDVAGLHAAATIVSGNGPVTFLSGRGNHRIENSFGAVDVRTNEGDITIQSGNGPVTAIDVNGLVQITNRFDRVRAVNATRGLTVRSNNGTIEAENIGGAVNITNSFGRVTVSEAKGDVTVQNQNGDVAVNGAAGVASLNTTFASVTGGRFARTLAVRAQNSHVRVDGVNESATVDTTFGGVDLRNVRGGARVTAGNSPIKLTAIGGEIYAKSTFAGITIADAAGPVTVENQNGSVVVDTKAGAGCKPVSLRTTFAPIKVSIAKGAGYNLTARTTFGRITTDPGVQVTVSGEISQNGLTGRIGGGGCDLQLIGQNASIDILSR
jgi:hypothetical protein